jgi:hypothetical protein
MWYKAIGWLVLGLMLLVAVSLILSYRHWQDQTQVLRQRLEQRQRSVSTVVYHLEEIASLPAPVKRYFQKVLTPGQSIVKDAQVSSDGQFSLVEEGTPRWVPFTADQKVTPQQIGFDWNARVNLAPGVQCLVHDAYVEGEGILHATLAGLLTLANLRGRNEIAKGELMRFLAESAWYPTALLPSQGVTWQPIDNHRAQATLQDGTTTVNLEFRFNQEDLIEGVYAAARDRTVQGKLVPMPWQGRFWNYEKHDGMLIPSEGEVAWQTPTGILPYWRGKVKTIRYEFAQ